MKLSASFAALALLLPFVQAQSPVWGQCGGIGWTGPTTCTAGNVCQEYSAYYSQCIPASQATSVTSVSTAPNPPPTSHTSTSSAPSGASTSTAKLNTLAKAKGKLYFGTATDNGELSDTAYTAILDDNTMFGQITPANSMKWDATEPQQGQFTFSGGDQIANLAKSNGMLLRGHNCVWYNQLPSWVSNGKFTAAQLTSIIQNHCSTLVTHYKGQVYAWDVVNEPFNDDGSWRTDVFYNTLGTSYVQIALEAARAADPDAKLYINEYNIEYAGAKATSLLNLVKTLKAASVPLDGIGFQSHFIVGQVPTGLQSQLTTFAAQGVEVAITELDIRMTLPSTPALLAQQKTDYSNVIKACASVEACVGVTVWDWTDKYSWVPNTFSGQGAACPWDQNFVRKPAYDGIAIGFGN
uniref:Endo-1,4-beta-xylanase A n=1 Tax=Phanerodontia chrysosporium TaxID=2822231 RepID=XYNA_PHACH|nr:RecName: Full=Endo-1,4-beta-xylanase A; Short=Xylanase A; AltName: Full=1,4-beta-D-xylan xylanohydrolase A; Flags: Precursor [Phanerodontia chrysosporium]AAG44993.1 endo-1,4-B-xylanase A [Phanerodontia chrysosporium]ABZ88797.1 endo-1,4-beta-xylanase A precursor [Phanerodontia chrysosporium]AEK97220.1 XynA [Phanerodontia chrysosporium]